MRILYIDIDTLRPDHLGCYGYHRNTSPNIDAVAQEGVRFDNCYVSDAPCLPSRAALWTGRVGFHTGVVGHGGTAADPFAEGRDRSFRDRIGNDGWISALRRLGLHTVTVSSFAERHGAWFWYAGYNEAFNPGKCGGDLADDVTPTALHWLSEHAAGDNWFLHVNYWDPHTPYRTPESFGNPFGNDPLPDWLTEEVRAAFWESYGPHSAQEPHHDLPSHPGFEQMLRDNPRLPRQLDSMDAVRRFVDGYDTGIRYADEHVRQLLAALASAGVLDDTVIIISSDHGENMGELNVWGDHQTADRITCRVPLIVRWPGLPRRRVDNGLHYHFDWMATLVKLLGGDCAPEWDAQPFHEAFRQGAETTRPYLVTSQCAWSCQRAVHFGSEGRQYQCLRTYHDGYKAFDPLMLFDVAADPHEQTNLAASHPHLVDRAMSLLTEWQHEVMLTAPGNVDPLMTVLREGGPFHTRGTLARYIDHLCATGRAHHARALTERHPDEL